MTVLIKLDPQTTTFTDQLLDLKDNLDSRDPGHLFIQAGCQDVHLTALSGWVKEVATASLRKISLTVNAELLQSPAFPVFLDALRANPCDSLVLRMTPADFEQAKVLLEEVVPMHANYPVLLVNAKNEGTLSCWEKWRFESRMVSAIQAAQKVTPIESSQSDDKTILEVEEKGAKRIRLKALINAKAGDKSQFNQYVQVDVEHVEVMENVTEVEEEVTVNLEQAIAPYLGELIDYAAFNQPLYHQLTEASAYDPEQIQQAYALVETELFANFPHAIKYLSPKAAEKLAEHLPQLVALNKENCPGFILKKTQKEEYVLDYDIDETGLENAFSPTLFTPYDTRVPYYNYFSFYEKDRYSKNASYLSHNCVDISTLIQNKHIKEDLYEKNYNPLSNLHTRQGEAGIRRFFTAIDDLDTQHPGLALFMYEHYLAHFAHLDHFYKDEFFAALSTLQNYTPLQINCLKRFLEHTGSSQHDLVKTLEGFDVFWHRVNQLCEGKESLLQQIDTDWETPKGGQPVVYMERLWTLLKNARNLSDQCACLSGIQLNAYGAYYASQYEGFKTVHPCMDFNYTPVKYQDLPFNTGFSLYGVSIDSLCELAKTTGNYINQHIINQHIAYSAPQEIWVIQDQSSNLTREEFNVLKAQNKVLPYNDYMTQYDSLPGNYSLYKEDLAQHKEVDGKEVKEANWENQGLHLIDKGLPLSAKKFYVFINRFMGLQLAGISMVKFIQELGEYKHFKKGVYTLIKPKNSAHAKFIQILEEDEKFKEALDELYGQNGNNNALIRDESSFAIPLLLLQILFFITHERYVGVIKQFRRHSVSDHSGFYYLLKYSESVVLKNMIEHIDRLKQLRSRNIQLSDTEALYYMAMQHFGRRNLMAKIVEEAHWNNVLREFPERLFNKLLNNKYAVLKFINFIGASLEPTGIKGFNGQLLLRSEMVTIYAFNTDDFFSKNTDIMQTFRDDLLLFSSLLVHYEFNVTWDDFNSLVENYNAENAFKKGQSILSPQQYQALDRLHKIRDCLQRATVGESHLNALHYTFKCMVDVGQFLDYEVVLTVFNAVENLPLKEGKLDVEYIHNILFINKIDVKKIQVPTLLVHDSEDVKLCLVQIILSLEAQGMPAMPSGGEVTEQSLEEQAKHKQQLIALNLVQLQEVLQQSIAKLGGVMAFSTQALLKASMGMLKDYLVKDCFSKYYNKATLPGELVDNKSTFMEACAQGALVLNDMQDSHDFEAVNKSVAKADSLALLCAAVSEHTCVKQNTKEALEVLHTLDYERLDSDSFFALFNCLNAMPARDYLPILKAILSNSEVVYNKLLFVHYLGLVSKLDKKEFSTQTITQFCTLFAKYPPKKIEDYDALVAQLIKIHSYEPEDSVGEFLLSDSDLDFDQITAISAQTVDISQYRDKLTALYLALHQEKQLTAFLTQTHSILPTQRPLVLSILARALATRSSKKPAAELLEVTKKLLSLKPEELEGLHALYESTPISLACLNNGLTELFTTHDFPKFLEAMEKSPFGKRDLAQQFSCEALERVVNASTDLLNKSSYPYQYRKQLMEAFLLVNSMGYELPVYQGKTAKDLSNKEIRDSFLALKNNTQWDVTQRRLSALVLMREAMYRSTGQLPYSTQMLVLLDCAFHKGNVISNVDTGQGKSLIDIMKAAFLWLESDRVDMSTSSLVDAKRDIENYSPFLSALGIPFALEPITASTDFSKFSTKGINFSTFSQLALFFSRAAVADYALDTPNNIVSFIVNESDYSLLDDLSVKRFACLDDVKISKKNEWVYTAINDFVRTPTFKANKSSEATDIRELRRFLKKTAKVLGKRPAFLKQLDNEWLLTHIESAILVNYKFQENVDYVVLPVADKVDCWSAKVLMSDTRPSPDSIFGKGVHQLLHARLNQDKGIKTVSGQEPFEIKPENTTIVSSTNGNLLDYYRAKKGFIWGSSGTVGSDTEIAELHSKYGFAFSKIEPHQKKQVQEKGLVLLKDKEAQYKRLLAEFTKKGEQARPTVIFCPSIDAAKELYGYLKNNSASNNLQLFTGVEENEAGVIKKAANKGMCTITTAAIGRNTDIPYDKTLGLDIWHTCISSTRLDRQKSGRTGRQGSPGEIVYYLNQADTQVNSQSGIQALRVKLDEAAKKERSFNANFYEVVGHFLTHLENMPAQAFTQLSKSAFFRNKWAAFSAKKEQAYRELHINKTFNKEVFAASFHAEFSALIKEAAPQYDVVQIKPYKEVAYSSKSTYQLNNKPVVVEDCIPPVAIAHSLYQSMQSEDVVLDAEVKKDLVEELEHVFSDVNNTNFAKKHTSFFTVLTSSKASQEELKGIYAAFLKEFLKKPEKSGFFARWFGFANHFNDIASNAHYLCCFRALASIDKKKPVVDYEVLKDAISGMIEEYLENAWFISADKRQAALALKASLDGATEIKTLVDALIVTQKAVAKSDMALNQVGWHKYLPVNFFGGSRLQRTLSNSLALAASLGVEMQTDTLVTGLTDLLADLVADKDKPSLKASSYAIESLAQSMPKKDKANVHVLCASLAKALAFNKKDYQVEGIEPEAIGLSH